MSFFIFYILLSFYHFSLSNATEDQNCPSKPTNCCSLAISIRGPPGFPGEHGLKGERGQKGEPGLKGEKGQAYESSFILEQTENDLRQLEVLSLCKDGVVVESTCYRLPYRSGPDLRFQEASDLCLFHGGVLAEIPTKDAYNAIFNYVKESWYLERDKNYMYIWLNSIYDQDQQTVVLREGGDSYVEWYPTYPTPVTGNIKMSMLVPTNSYYPAAYVGMFNTAPDHSAIPLCQFSLI